MATFSLDGSPPVLVTHATTMPVQFQFEFWRAESLSMGSHLLEITNVGNEAYFRLDRIDYDPIDHQTPKQYVKQRKVFDIRYSLDSSFDIGRRPSYLSPLNPLSLLEFPNPLPLRLLL